MIRSNLSFYGLLIFEKGFRERTTATLLELHLNLWEQDQSIALDIGVMVGAGHDAKTLEVFFPWALGPDNLVDLYDRIAPAEAISAIFNESWSVTATGRERASLVQDPEKLVEDFVVIALDGAVESRQGGSRWHFVSIDLGTLRDAAAAASGGVRRIYFRFRARNVPKSFYCVGIDRKKQDRFVVSSWQSTEIIDLRVNVRRGAPNSLEREVGGRYAEFSKVHLFLMRPRDHDLTFHDPLFKSCRSLEDEAFWAGYSFDEIWHRDGGKDKALLHVRDSLGYQWSNRAKGAEIRDSVMEFAVLARFKKVKFGLWPFVVVAVIFGAVGSGLYDGSKYAVNWGISKICPPTAAVSGPTKQPESHR
jgi:hypothetical protein